MAREAPQLPFSFRASFQKGRARAFWRLHTRLFRSSVAHTERLEPPCLDPIRCDTADAAVRSPSSRASRHEFRIQSPLLQRACVRLK